MKILDKISDYIHEEIHDADKYVRAALVYKEEYPEIAETFYVLSVEEVSHVQILHNAAIQIITRYKKENGEPPKDMLAIYNYVHKKLIDEEKEVKILQNMYKE